MTIFLRLLDVPVNGKASALGEMVDLANGDIATRGSPRRMFRRNPTSFKALPRSSFGYWGSSNVLSKFQTFTPLHNGERIAASTNPLTEDTRYVRVWWESAGQSGSTPRRPWAKGGAFSPFYADIATTIDWDSDRATYRGFLGGTSAWRRSRRQDEVGANDVRPAEPPANYSHFLRPGLTWPRRTSGLSFRALPSGSVFADKGPAIFVPNDDDAGLMALCSLINSRPFAFLMGLQLARTELAQSYEVGIVQLTPVPDLAGVAGAELRVRGARARSLKRSLDTITETSHAFLLPALLQVSGANIADRAAAWSTHVAEVEAELVAIQREIDDIAFHLYGIDGEDRARIEAESGTTRATPAAEEAEPGEEPEAAEDDGDDEEDDGDDEEDDSSAADAATLATELLSWAVGVAFGRFDIDYAGGLREPPPEPGPFDPLPARCPGMSPDDSHAVEVLVDEDGHPEDLVQRIANVFGHAFGPGHDERLDEAVQLAGASDLRTWLRRSFLPFHLKRYSKSRRKAPIWWPLSTASGSYTLWVAWPRLTRDTLFRLTSEQEPYIAAKVAQETRKLTSLKQDAGKAPTTAQAKAIGAQEDFVAELTALRDELAMIAPMWNPVHDDGVVLHAALLWRVFRDAGWQKECREKWEGLAAGKYDWAHIAMHLWPERVVPKCREDRSLAIAHGLEERFWVEIAGKWRLRDGTGARSDEEIAARSSAAVKKALRAFVEAPAPARGRRGKKGK
jgi:hypothetical protein